jgi:tetratricopeptide (TPR) repeat protein
MVRKFILLGMIAISLFADSYKDAIKDLKTGKFESAYQKLDKLIFEYAGDSEYNFYYGRAALETRRYNEAIGAFERVLINKPNHLRTRLELARAYFQSGDYVEARSAFEMALASNPPKEVKEKINYFLTRISEYEKRDVLKFNLMAGIAQDSNAKSSHNGSINDMPSINNFSFNNIPSKAEKDTYHQFMGNLNYKYDGGRKGFWYLQTDFMFYSQKYQHIDDNVSFDYVAFSIAPSYIVENTDISFPLKVEKLTLGDANYLTASNIGLSTKTFLNSSILGIGFNFKKKVFAQDDDKDKNSRVNELKISYSKSFDLLNFNVLLENSQEFKDNKNSSADVEKDMNAATFRIGTNSSKKLFVSYYMSVKNYFYRNKSRMYNSKRFDHYIANGFSFNYMLKKEWVATVGIDNINNSSNQMAFDYNKNVIYARVNYSFVQ